MDGIIEELSGSLAEEAKKKLISKYGEDADYYNDPKLRFLKFKPTWIRVRLNTRYPFKYEVIES